MSFWVVYSEGLRAITRGKAAAFGIATLFILIALLATTAGVDVDGLTFYFMVAYVVVPTGLAAFTAVQFATGRATKFVQAVFTAPVSRASYFFANAAVAVTVGLIYLLLTLPFALVQSFYVGVPAQLGEFFAAGLVMVAFGTSFGTLVAVVFTGRSVVPAATVAAFPIVLLLCIAVVYVGIFTTTIDRETGREVLSQQGKLLVRLGHLSPHVNAMDAFDLWDDPTLRPDRPMLGLAAYLGVLLAMFAIAAFAYLRLQGVEDWDAGSRAQSIIGILLLVLVVAPAIGPFAIDYEDLQPDPPGSEFAREWFELSLTAAVTRPGAATPGVLQWARYEGRFDLGPPTPFDLLIAFPAPAGFNVSGYSVMITPTPGVEVVGPNRFDAAAWRATETYREPYGRDRRPMALLRLPITVVVDEAPALANVPIELNVTANFTVEGRDPAEEGEPFSYSVLGHGTAEFFASVPGVQLPVSAAMFVAPLAFVVHGILRVVRRR